MLFKERTELALKKLLNQPLVTLEEAKEQVEWLKRKTTIKKKTK